MYYCANRKILNNKDNQPVVDVVRKTIQEPIMDKKILTPNGVSLNLGSEVKDNRIPVEDSKNQFDDSNINKVCFINPADEIYCDSSIKDDVKFYAMIDSCLAKGVMNSKIAAKMITDEIRHRSVVENKVDQIDWVIDHDDELREVFEPIQKMINIHLDTFIRYQQIYPNRKGNRVYYTIYDIVENNISRLNEYYQLDIDFNKIKKELNNFYSVFK